MINDLEINPVAPAPLSQKGHPGAVEIGSEPILERLDAA
jgi:hypothetical protein